MKKISLIYIIYFITLITVTILVSTKIINKQFSLNPLGMFWIRQIDSLHNDAEDIRSLEDVIELEVSEKILRNSQGFNDYEWNIEKPPNTYRIIALGDSMTEGPWISTNDTWPKQLEKKLNELNLSYKFEIFNFGRGGANTKEEVELFKRFGLNYTPGMLILQYYVNDCESSSEMRKKSSEMFEKWKKGEYKFPEELEEAIRRLNASDSAVSGLIWVMIEKDYYNRDWERGCEENVIQPLKELISISKERKIQLIIVTWDLDLIPGQKNRLELLFKEYNVSLYDFTESVPFQPSPSSVRLEDYHLTPFGNEIITNKTLPIILNELI